MKLDELVQAALAGNREALEQLARRLDTVLRRYFMARVARDVADDLAQSTFVAMLENMDRFEPRGENTFVRWVYGIARNVSSAEHRANTKAARRRGKLAKLAKTPARGLSSFIMLMESVELLDQEIEQLTVAQQQAVAGFLRKERGGALSPNHCAVTLHRARNKLRRGLTERMTTPEPPQELAAANKTPPAT